MRVEKVMVGSATCSTPVLHGARVETLCPAVLYTPHANCDWPVRVQ